MPTGLPRFSRFTPWAAITAQAPDHVWRGIAIRFTLRCSLMGMGTLIYGFTVSVDGYIADAHGDIDWSDPSD